MKTLLELNVGSEIFVKNKAYMIIQKEKFFQNNAPAVRYTISNKREKKFLEIKREFALNYQIFLYELIESFAYDFSFLSILGTNTLGYKNPKISKNNIYTKVNLKNQKYDLIKHIVDKDDLPKDYLEKGYHQDEYGEWYFYTKRYKPTIREFDGKKLYLWEYKQNGNIRLQITTNYIEKSNILIFKGEELWQSEVTTLPLSKISQQPQKSQIPSMIY